MVHGPYKAEKDEESQKYCYSKQSRKQRVMTPVLLNVPEANI